MSNFPLLGNQLPTVLASNCIAVFEHVNPMRLNSCSLGACYKLGLLVHNVHIKDGIVYPPLYLHIPNLQLNSYT